MKIVITGTRGLATALKTEYQKIDSVDVRCLDRTQHNIHDVHVWGNQYHYADMIINCAYDRDGQLKVLEYFARMWRNDPAKCIVTIGSTAADYVRLEPEKDNEFWMYRYDKKILQEAVKDLRSECKCDVRIYNPGAIDTNMIKHLSVAKYNPIQLARHIIALNGIPGLKRADLWL